jgi:hypothetical protein
MVTLAKGMIGLSTLIAVGYVGMGSLNDARPQPTPASVIADRFVFTADIPAPVGEGVDLTAARRDAAAALAAVTLAMDTTTKKGDRLEIQLSAEAKPAHRPVRYATFERQTGPSTSEIVRIPVTEVATR